MKRAVVTIPDNYNIQNVIERIKIIFNDPQIVVEHGEAVNGKLGDMLRAVGNFQRELKEIDQL